MLFLSIQSNYFVISSFVDLKDFRSVLVKIKFEILIQVSKYILFNLSLQLTCFRFFNSLGFSLGFSTLHYKFLDICQLCIIILR